MTKQKQLTNLYKDIKPYVKLELVRNYMSTLYGVEIKVSYISQLIDGKSDNVERVEQVHSVLVFIKRLLKGVK